jgi:hypothetical protein
MPKLRCLPEQSLGNQPTRQSLLLQSQYGKTGLRVHSSRPMAPIHGARKRLGDVRFLARTASCQSPENRLGPEIHVPSFSGRVAGKSGFSGAVPLLSIDFHELEISFLWNSHHVFRGIVRAYSVAKISRLSSGEGYFGG